MSKKMNLSCEVCAKPVVRYPSTLRPHVYCSRKCLTEAKKNGSELFCALCDSRFYRRFGEQDIGERVHQFCTRDCYMQWRAIHRKANVYPKIGPRHEHRIVAERILGRALLPSEVVHHIDLNKHNNAPENLMVLPDHTTHMRVHYGKVSDAELLRFSLV